MPIETVQREYKVYICDDCGATKNEFISFGWPHTWDISNDETHIHCGECRKLPCLECGNLTKIANAYHNYSPKYFFCSKQCHDTWHRKQFTILCKIGGLPIKYYTESEAIGVGDSPEYLFAYEFVDVDDHCQNVSETREDFIQFIQELAKQLNIEFKE